MFLNPSFFRHDSIHCWLRSWWNLGRPARLRKNRGQQIELQLAEVICLESRVMLSAPVVTPSTARLAANATSLTIAGSGFIVTATSNSVVLNDTVTGKSITVTPTSATTTSLVVPLTGIGTLTGGDHLTAVVTSGGVSSGAAVQVATVGPVVTQTTPVPTLGVNATTLTIAGVGFDPTAAHNSVVVTDTKSGTSITVTPTSVTAKSLTVSLSGIGTLSVGDNLTAVVTTNAINSGTAVQVATIVPIVTRATPLPNLPANSTTLTINGFGFDPNKANNRVNLTNNGKVVANTILAATSTSLTVTFTGPLSIGSITAVVIADNVSSGTPVEVAAVSPVVTMNTAILPVGATSIVIHGFGFDPNHAQNTVVFSSGAVGIVTACSTTSLTVTFLTKPKTAGPLTVVVTTRHVSSGAAVQVATV